MIRMPWNHATAPSAMIEVTDACNIACVCCYKNLGEQFKSLADIERDIDDACRLRPLHTLTISGGEPTLHPDLCAIIERIKRRGLLTFLLTNGVLVDDSLAHRLKCAGLDASASMTLLEDAPEQLGEIVEFFLASRDLNFLFLARGITSAGLYGDANRPAPDSCESGLTLRVFMDILHQRHAILPFS
jgi:hypothetical protein